MDGSGCNEWSSLSIIGEGKAGSNRVCLVHLAMQNPSLVPGSFCWSMPQRLQLLWLRLERDEVAKVRMMSSNSGICSAVCMVYIGRKAVLSNEER